MATPPTTKKGGMLSVPSTPVLPPIEEEEEADTHDGHPLDENTETAPQPPEAVLYTRSPNPAAIGQNGAVRQVCGVLMQGARYSRATFGAHTSLLSAIQAALAAKDEDAFLNKVESYLQQAEGRLMHAARKEDIPLLIDGLRLFIGELTLLGHDGLFLVGRYLLSAPNSIVDFF